MGGHHRWNLQSRGDMSVGSMTVTEERTEVLDLSPAYYYTPASIAVAEDSDVTLVDQLTGRPSCVLGSHLPFLPAGHPGDPRVHLRVPDRRHDQGFRHRFDRIQALVRGRSMARCRRHLPWKRRSRRASRSNWWASPCPTSRCPWPSTRNLSWTRRPSRPRSPRLSTGSTPTARSRRCHGVVDTTLTVSTES